MSIFIVVCCFVHIFKGYGSTVTGFFNNDTLTDTLRYENVPNDKDIIHINLSLSATNTTICTLNYEYEVSEDNIIIYCKNRGEIIIFERGSTGGASEYFHYYEYNPLVNTWCLVKSITITSGISGEGYAPPSIEIDYTDGSIGLNGNTIDPSKRLVESDKIRGIRMHNDLFTLNDSLSICYKKKQLNNINKSLYDLTRIGELMHNIPLSDTTLEIYNNLGFYFSFNDSALSVALYILENILTQYPKRIVAYLNCADAYFKLGEIEKATLLYRKYADFMKFDGKENNIPKRVLERFN
jgi:hypothetical protein